MCEKKFPVGMFDNVNDEGAALCMYELNTDFW